MTDPADDCADALPEASFYISPVEDGGSIPLLFGFDDGVKRVVKMPGSPQSQGDRHLHLVNDLVASRLAQLIGAPCPPARVVWVGRETLDVVARFYPRARGLRAGRAFASVWFEAIPNPSEQNCREAVNREQLAALVVLYRWTRNEDYKLTHLIWRQLNGDHEVLGVDHGFCFGFEWDETIRTQDPFDRNKEFPPLGLVATPAEITHYIERAEQLPREAIDDCVTCIPPEWGATTDELKACADYLDHGRTKLRGIVGSDLESTEGGTR